MKQKLMPKAGFKQVTRNFLIGNRIPKTFFITSGIGESNITIHAGSYHLALGQAGIERCNIMTYSSILPGIASEVPKPDKNDFVHGSVMETIMATANAKKGQRATAGVAFAWLYGKDNGQKYGGIVAEYNGHLPEIQAQSILKSNIREMYEADYSEDFDINDIKITMRSFIPKKKFGTAIVALCFKNYVFPVLEERMELN